MFRWGVVHGLIHAVLQYKYAKLISDSTEALYCMYLMLIDSETS